MAEVDTNAHLVAADLVALGVKAGAKAFAVTKTFGEVLLGNVRKRASLPRTGPPGPRLITGDYVRSMSVQTSVADGSPIAVAGTNAPQARRLEFGFNDTDSLGRRYCVAVDTEVLTDQGWKTHDAVCVGDQVLTLNPDRWVSQWQPVDAIWMYPQVPVLEVDARTLSAVTTPDHRWLVERYYGRQKTWLPAWRTTATMPANVRVPLSAKCGDLPVRAKIDDDVVELAAWFWTEGSYMWGRGGTNTVGTRPIALRLSQSPRVNPEKCERIERLLTRLFGPPAPFVDGGHWHLRYRPLSGTNTYTLDRVACWLTEKAVEPPAKALRPEFLLQLTQPQLDLLIEVSLLADGHVDAAGVTRLGQRHEGRIRSWEMACVLAGRAVRTRATANGDWVTTTLRSSWSHGFGSALRKDRDHADLRQGVADVWCPSTPNGTWLARRNGSIYFTGNSQPPYPHWGPALDEVGAAFAAAIASLVDGLDVALPEAPAVQPDDEFARRSAASKLGWERRRAAGTA